MAACDAAHKNFDRLANGKVQSGTLPPWLHIEGRVAWYVYQGPYSGIARAFPAFGAMADEAFPGLRRGPPGDVYVCSPHEHVGERAKTLTTIFWVPIE